VIVPRAPGQFSAWGMLMTDLRHDFIRTHILACESGELEAIRSDFDGLERQAFEQFAAEGIQPARVAIDRSLDLRYKGQEHTVRTPLREGDLGGGRLGGLIGRFHDLHEQAYSFRQADPVEIVNLHVTAWGRVDRPALAPQRGPAPGIEDGEPCKGSRRVVFEGEGSLESRVFERSLLPIGTTLEGPAVIEEPSCTTIVYPAQRVEVDSYGNLIITEVTK
jgi:N-methylhydantoinase A